MVVSVFGTEPIILLSDPNNREHAGDTEGGKSVLSIEKPAAGEWTLYVADTSAFTTKIGISWEIFLDYGFSVGKPGSSKDILKNPIKGRTLLAILIISSLIKSIYHSSGSENIFSIFLSNPKYVAEITNIKIIQNGQIIKTVTLHQNDESSYSSDPFVVPSGQFKIFIEGLDSNGNSILKETAFGVYHNGNNYEKDDTDSLTPKEEKEVENLLELLKFRFIFKKFKGLFDCSNRNENL